MKFKLNYVDKNTNARACTLVTDHGEIKTPIFMPVGTAATIKGVHQRDIVNDIDPDVILSNTYIICTYDLVKRSLKKLGDYINL